jgi:hypothetical protein
MHQQADAFNTLAELKDTFQEVSAYHSRRTPVLAGAYAGFAQQVKTAMETLFTPKHDKGVAALTALKGEFDTHIAYAKEHDLPTTKQVGYLEKIGNVLDLAK